MRPAVGRESEDDVVESYVASLESSSPSAQQASSTLSSVLMASYCGICGLSLVGGAVVGGRSFESSAAHEALDKLPAATASSEALAMKYAVRALGLGTALCMGTAICGVVFMRNVLEIRTMADVQSSARRTLEPFELWLRHNGRRIEAISNRMGSSLPDLGAWTRGSDPSSTQGSSNRD